MILQEGMQKGEGTLAAPSLRGSECVPSILGKLEGRQEGGRRQELQYGLGTG
jgi:hypothetical protein